LNPGGCQNLCLTKHAIDPQEPRSTTRHPSQGFIVTSRVSFPLPATNAVFSRSSESTEDVIHGQRDDVWAATSWGEIGPAEMAEESVGVRESIVRGRVS
jgi:hypothetical protein